jgi:hypothetical protein
VADLAALFQQLDPRPLPGDDDRYVDWQREFDADDVKTRLVASVLNTPANLGSQRLLTGPRGAGKSSELLRVTDRLRRGVNGRQAFVSFLESRWFDLDDITATDVSFNMVRQLVDDLRTRARLDLKTSPFVRLVERLKDIGLEVDVWGVSLSTALRERPAERRRLRDVLDGELPAIWDDINGRVLDQVRTQFAEIGIERIVIMVDDLDKIEPREIRDGLTNLDVLYLSDAGKLKALRCDVVLTVPIEYWFSSTSTRLSDTYGEVLELGILPTLERDRSDGPGVAALRHILERRMARADVDETAVEGGWDTLTDVIRRSGGQIRLVFQLLRSAIDRSDGAPSISRSAIDRALAGQRRTFRHGLNDRHWAVLDAAVDTFRVDTTDDTVAELLRTSRLLPYLADDGAQWYGVHPLLLRDDGTVQR